MSHNLDTTHHVRSLPGLLSTIWLRRADRTARQGATRHDASPVGPELRPRQAPFPATFGTRFDDTVALPLDATRRLDEVIRLARRQLRDMPRLEAIGHRSVALRVQLERRLQAALRARGQLAAGTYGTCVDCLGPISLTRLLERPWSSRCIYCALDI